MAFIDPFELLNLSPVGEEGLPAEELRRAKRKLLAEFELAGGYTIPYRGRQIDKAEALAALEELEDPVAQMHLWAIHRNPILINLLRDGNSNDLHKLPQVDKLGTPEFRKYLSAKLHPVYNQLVGQAIRGGKWFTVNRLLHHLDLIDSWDHEPALKSMIAYIRLSLRRVKELTDNSTGELATADEPELYAEQFAKALNRLPKTFQQQRNQYAEGLQEYATALDEQVDRTSLAYMVISTAVLIETDTAVSQWVHVARARIWMHLKSKKEASFANVTNEGGPNFSWTATTSSSTGGTRKVSGETGRAGCYLLAILAVVIFLLRSCGGGSGSSSRFNYKVPEIHIPKIPEWKPISAPTLDSAYFAHQHRLDSILAEIRAKYPMDSFAYTPMIMDTIPERRIDTMLFKDLIFYETLQQLPRQKQWRDLARPSTGASPYRALLMHSFSSDTVHPMRIVNESAYDAVFFLETAFNGKAVYNYYVRSGDSLTLERIPTIFYHVRTYAGKGWALSDRTYKDQMVPGFVTQGFGVNTGMYTEDSTGQAYLIHIQMTDWRTDEPKPTRVVLYPSGLVSTY